MHTRLSAVFLLGVLFPLACDSQPRNPLIGEWKLVQSDCEVVTQIKYTPTTYSSFESPAGVYPGWRAVSVKYNVADPKEVWVMVRQGNDTRVFVLDANHIRPDDAKQCIYERVK